MSNQRTKFETKNIMKRVELLIALESKSVDRIVIKPCITINDALYYELEKIFNDDQVLTLVSINEVETIDL